MSLKELHKILPCILHVRQHFLNYLFLIMKGFPCIAGNCFTLSNTNPQIFCSVSHQNLSSQTYGSSELLIITRTFSSLFSRRKAYNPPSSIQMPRYLPFFNASCVFRKLIHSFKSPAKVSDVSHRIPWRYCVSVFPSR